jgi:hypothetical protein
LPLDKSSVNFGMWRSPVAHLHGVQGVAGSNPVIPTRKEGAITRSEIELSRQRLREAKSKLQGNKEGAITRSEIELSEQISNPAGKKGSSETSRKGLFLFLRGNPNGSYLKLWRR